MDPIEMFSAFVSGLTLLLSEMRRRRPDNVEVMRAQLLGLQRLVYAWAGAARETNLAAKDWAGSLPETVGSAREFLEPAFASQWDAARRYMESDVEFSIINGGEESFEDLLRVYAPKVQEMKPWLSTRWSQLREGIAEELERRFAADGSQAVASYIAELGRVADGLNGLADELAKLLRTQLPLAARSPGH